MNLSDAKKKLECKRLYITYFRNLVEHNNWARIEVLFSIVIGFGMSMKLLGECGVHESQVQGCSMYYILYNGVWYCWVLCMCHSSGTHSVFVTNQCVAERLARTVWKPVAFRWDVVRWVCGYVKRLTGRQLLVELPCFHGDIICMIYDQAVIPFPYDGDTVHL